MLVDSARRRAVWFLGIFSAAGVFQAAVKLWTAWMQTRRMKRMLEDVPHARYSTDHWAGFVKDLRDNKHRSHDFHHEATLGLPVSKMFGLPFETSHVWLVVRDPACIKHFLKDSFNVYSKPGDKEHSLFHLLKMWLGDGIFTMQHGLGAADNGHAWLTQRKIAANIFSKANFRHNMGEVFADKVRRLVTLLQGPAAKCEAVDLQHLFFCFTMDSIMKIFFGEDSFTMEGDACTYGDAYDTAHRTMIEYIRSSNTSLLLLSRMPWPLGGYDGLGWWLHGAMNPLFRTFKAATKTLSKESARLVASCRTDPCLKQRKDLLALFVQAEEKEKFTVKYLKDMVLNFVIAGRDTTACTLSWMFFVLATNMEVQSKVIAEIDKCCPDGVVPTLQKLTASEMPYLNGLLYEVLRLYPPVPNDRKSAFADDVLPDGTKVPKGTWCLFLPYAMGRDAAVYPEPERVKPERWIPFTAPAPHEFPVFQAGPRICLGMDMAIFEAKLVAVMLLQKFNFELLPGEAEKIHYAATITMSICNSKKQDSHNLWVIPRSRT